MADFKTGQRVVCNVNPRGILRIGAIYTIVSVRPSGALELEGVPFPNEACIKYWDEARFTHYVLMDDMEYNDIMVADEIYTKLKNGS